MSAKTVLVTGGARGIGLGIAHAFLEAGHRVMIADLGASADWNYQLASQDDLEQAVAEEQEGAGEVASCELNVTNADSCEAAIAKTLERFGGLDVLVNNAGVVDTGPTETFAEEDWDRIFAVNTKGIFLMTRAAIPALKASSSAAIVNIASIAGKEGSPQMAAYCGSKFAAIGITQSIARELALQNITVNAICPGVLGTAMWIDHLMVDGKSDKSAREGKFEQLMQQRVPLGRPQTTEDIGQAAVYLASARNVTGIALNVAGGMTLH